MVSPILFSQLLARIELCQDDTAIQLKKWQTISFIGQIDFYYFISEHTVILNSEITSVSNSTPSTTPTPHPTPTITPTPTVTALTVAEYATLAEQLIEEFDQSITAVTAEVERANSLLNQGDMISSLTVIGDAHTKLAQDNVSILARWDALIPPPVFVDFHECYPNLFEDLISYAQTMATCCYNMDVDCMESMSTRVEEITAKSVDCQDILSSIETRLGL